MKYDKQQLTDIFISGERLLKDFHLPTWEELPTIELYMDQVIVLLNGYLSIFCEISNDDKLITATMIHNYVKQKIIPAPIKKKYSKMHLAYLIMVCILKQTLSIPMISKMIPPDLSEEEMISVYSSFIKNHAKAFTYVTEQITAVAQPILAMPESNQDRMNDLVLQVASSANIFKLLTGWITREPSEEIKK